MSERRDLDEANLGLRLGVLAEYGAQSGRRRPAAQIRRRGDRRRRNARLAATAAGLAVIGILGGGIALIQQQNADGQGGLPPASPGPAVSPSATTGPTSAATAQPDPSAVPGDGIPAREQAVWLRATNTPGNPLLTALPSGAVGVTAEPDAGDGALFALIPVRPGADEYLLKTGTLASWGEPGCAMLDGRRVIIGACDAGRSEQRVTLGGDGPPYEVVLGGRALSVTPDGVTAVEPGSGTRVTFIIRGRAQDPFD
jgi:hypothetical protein